MKSNEQIAIDQRDYWKSVRSENKNSWIGQQEPGGPSLPVDPFAVSPADWQEYWNLQISGANRD
jgi:hypothetical protein